MNNKAHTGIQKTVQKKEDLFIEFTQEEMDTLGIKPHDKFEVEIQDDQTLVFKKFAKIDINLSEFDKSTLEMLVSESIDKQVPVDEIIRETLKSYIKTQDF
jgi:hypothetical protein